MSNTTITKTAPATWTQPYYGIQHLGRPSDRRWATVSEMESGMATLVCWYLGCGFIEPQETTHDTAEEARSAGEAWVSGRA